MPRAKAGSQVREGLPRKSSQRGHRTEDARRGVGCQRRRAVPRGHGRGPAALGRHPPRWARCPPRLAEIPARQPRIPRRLADLLPISRTWLVPKLGGRRGNRKLGSQAREVAVLAREGPAKARGVCPEARASTEPAPAGGSRNRKRPRLGTTPSRLGPGASGEANAPDAQTHEPVGQARGEIELTRERRAGGLQQSRSAGPR